MEYQTRLAFEAIFVGATLVPFVLATERIIKSPILSVFTAGLLYHLSAELSGLNEWYLEHGASTLNRIEEIREEASRPQTAALF